MLRARVEVRGLEIHYRQWGTAETPTVVLAHGLPDGGFVWSALARELDGVRRLIAFDLPGFGESAAPRGFAHTVSAYGDVFDGFVESLNLDRFDLAVHDVSGAYALPHAAARRDRLTSLLILNTQVFTGWRHHALARRYRRPALGRLMTFRPPRRRFEKLLRPAFAAEPPRWYLDELWAVWSRRQTRRAVMRFYRRNEPEAWGPAERSLERLQGVPATVVWGDADPFIRGDFAERTAEALGADLFHVPDAGHFPMVERPQAVAAAARTLWG
jgi:pimeloyl-ACP methyl ester carboxylesterase